MSGKSSRPTLATAAELDAIGACALTQYVYTCFVAKLDGRLSEEMAAVRHRAVRIIMRSGHPHPQSVLAALGRMSRTRAGQLAANANRPEPDPANGPDQSGPDTPNRSLPDTPLCTGTRAAAA